MASLVPQYLQARNLKSAKIQAGVPVAGSITWSTAVDIAKFNSTLMSFKAFEFNGQPSSENLKPSDSTMANYQIDFDDFTATIRELVPANGTGALNALQNQYDYFRYEVVYHDRGAGGGFVTVGTRMIVIGVRDASPFQLGAGENTAALTLKPAGIPIFLADTSVSIPAGYS